MTHSIQYDRLKKYPIFALLLLACLPWIVNGILPQYDHIASLTIPSTGRSEVEPVSTNAFPYVYTVERKRERLRTVLELEFEIPETFTGRITGHVSGHQSRHRPKLLKLNDYAVSDIAFCHGEDAGVYQSPQVEFSAGLNQFEISGFIDPSTIYNVNWELKRRLSFLKCIAIWITGVVFWIVRKRTRAFVERKPYIHLMLLVPSTVIVVSVFLAPMVDRSRPCMVKIGQHTAPLIGVLEEFESYLNSDEHTDKEESRFSVPIFGDSTHRYKLADHFMPRLQFRNTSDKNTSIEFYGLSYFALGPWEYFLLLNRLSLEEPDLIVLPVNLRYFTDYNMNLKLSRIYAFDHFVRWGEIPGALEFKVADREFRWSKLLWTKFDARYFNRDLTPLFNGLKSELRTWYRYRLNFLLNLQPERWESFPDKGLETVSPESAGYELVLDQDHPLLQVYSEINRFAEENGLTILYYQTDLDDTWQDKMGLQCHVDENYRFLEEFLSKSPNASYYIVNSAVPSSLHVDAWGHMTDDGIRIVADDLFEKVTALSKRHQDEM